MFSDLEYIHDPRHAEMLLHRYERMQELFPAMLRAESDTVMELMDLGIHQIHEVNSLYSPSEENLQQAVHRLVSCNAVFSLAASMSGVYALYHHSLMRRFDIKISAITSITQERPLLLEMVETYCMIIRQAGHESCGEFSDSVRQLLYRHLLEPLSIDDLARQMHVAPATLCRRFKAETGTTVRNAMNEQRIRLAQLYIQEGDASITDVAFRVGFRDVSYFNKVFYRYTGKHPREYRTSFKENQIT